MRGFFGNMLTMYTLIAFVLGVFLSGWVMSLLGRGRSAVKAGG